MPTADEVLITDLALVQHGDIQELSAQVDGERLWFQFPASLPLCLRAELFFPVALQEAMVRGVPLRLAEPYTISDRLLDNLATLQAILTTWNSEDFRVVPIHAASTSAAQAQAQDWTISCYSGGIDSSYTYSRHRDQISHLLLVQGFDSESDDDSWRQNIAARRAFAESEGKQLIPVACNVRQFIMQRKLSWGVSHGSLLAALGVSLSAKRLLIPSSFTYSELFPWGSHPLLDCCWSTEATEVIHHGLEASRTEKTEYIAAHQNILDHLQVCWRSVDQNCGNCPKCVRTSLALHLLGKSSRSLPVYQDISQLRWLKPGNHASLAFTDDLIGFCLERGADDLARQLLRYRKHYLLKYHSAEIIKVLFGRLARAVSRRFWPKDWHQDRAKIHAGKSWN